ncbi:MAG TPA: gliding motility-associated C-terminal domain-containing protein, partial [Bacteroidia bacterium]|nr:gliding motility-associated C-terminal domain-containing protein [Bacteroidia bacterium]
CDFLTAFNLNWPPSAPVAANNPYPIMALWNKLMDNDTFRSDFLSRYEDLINTALSCDSLADHLKYVRSQLSTSAMASHVYWLLYDGINFPTQDSVHYWNMALDSMHAFIMQRCSLVTEGLKNCFNFNGPFNLCVDVAPSGTGYVLLNSLTLKNFIWNGKYLDSVTMVAHAIPDKNYQFDHWETTPTSYTLNPNNKSDSINFFVSRDLCLKAVFKLKPADQTYGDPMIPTGFSPNGDGNNDIFNVYGIADASSYELEIYNRWGEMIFRSIDKGHGWDGSYNGAPAPVGIYAYRYNVVLNGKTYKSKGSVTLLR